MFILITYDVKTDTNEGRRRLRHVAKTCLNYGQRVQNSVFECKVNEAEFCMLKHILENIIDKNKDNLRFYRLGKNYEKSVDKLGIDLSYDIEGLLVL